MEKKNVRSSARKTLDLNLLFPPLFDQDEKPTEGEVPVFTVGAYFRHFGDCDFQVVDILVAPWVDGKAPKYYYLKRWAISRIDKKLVDTVIADFNESNELKSGWYRMTFRAYEQRVAKQHEMFAIVKHEKPEQNPLPAS